MTAVAQGVPHPAEAADVGHEVEGHAQPARPRVGEAHLFQLGEDLHHAATQLARAAVQVQIGAQILPATEQQPVVGGAAEVVEQAP